MILNKISFIIQRPIRPQRFGVKKMGEVKRKNAHCLSDSDHEVARMPKAATHSQFGHFSEAQDIFSQKRVSLDFLLLFVKEKKLKKKIQLYHLPCITSKLR